MNDTQQTVDEALKDLQPKPLWHAWVTTLDGQTNEYYGTHIKVVDGKIEVRNGKEVFGIPLGNVKGYTINEP